MIIVPKDEVHISIDMESLAAKATRPALLSIGAVEFDPNQVQTPEAIATNPHCYITVSLEGQTDKYGRVVEGDTIAWWMSQGADARKLFADMASNGVSLPNALQELNRWIAGLLDRYSDVSSAHSHAVTRPQLKAWSYGAKSDLVWWATACEDAGIEYPVHYRGEKCLRTLAGEFPEVAAVEYGVKHNALDDAIAQAAWCQRLRTRVRGVQGTEAAS